MNSMKWRTSLNQAGDTIIEVLIAIAIITFVLASAYALSRRSIAATQDTQEHTQAQKLVEGQIEYLRAAGSIGTNMCFDNSGAAVADSTAACTAATATGSTVPYSLTITTPDSVTYTVSATWDSLLGGKNNVTMVYKPA
jgi:Tfp pilus assembly protein PilV